MPRPCPARGLTPETRAAAQVLFFFSSSPSHRPPGWMEKLNEQQAQSCYGERMKTFSGCTQLFLQYLAPCVPCVSENQRSLLEGLTARPALVLCVRSPASMCARPVSLTQPSKGGPGQQCGCAGLQNPGLKLKKRGQEDRSHFISRACGPCLVGPVLSQEEKGDVLSWSEKLHQSHCLGNTERITCGKQAAGAENRRGKAR